MPVQSSVFRMTCSTGGKTSKSAIASSPERIRRSLAQSALLADCGSFGCYIARIERALIEGIGTPHIL